MNNYFTHTQGITTLSHDAPQWLVDAVYEAHNGEMPNEFVYHACAVIMDAINEGEDVMETAHSMVSTYVPEALEWLSGNIYRMGYCDDAISEGGIERDTHLIDLILAGQRVQLEIIAETMENAVREAEVSL